MLFVLLVNINFFPAWYTPPGWPLWRTT